MGLVIQRIEPNARVYNDGRMRPGDRIIEINGRSLIGVDFLASQGILRETIQYSNQHLNGQLDFKLVRQQQSADDNDNEEYSNERSIEADLADKESNHYHDDKELQYEINKQQCLDPENKENNESISNTSLSYLNNNPCSVNMSALNTKKLGKKIVVQLVKGPQGLGFKLAARDNCSQGEYSPIYIKNILPKGAAIADARLQRGDRLLEVNQMDMACKTLHEAVNILRNTKLGSTVEIVVSRQMVNTQQQMQPQSASMDTQTEIYNDINFNKSSTEHNQQEGDESPADLNGHDENRQGNEKNLRKMKWDFEIFKTIFKSELLIDMYILFDIAK